jgi:putative transcriptional regulator
LTNNIKKLREEKGISQTELAKRLKVSRFHLSRIENGEVNCTIRMAVRIAQNLECGLDEIFLK